MHIVIANVTVMHCPLFRHGLSNKQRTIQTYLVLELADPPALLLPLAGATVESRDRLVLLRVDDGVGSDRGVLELRPVSTPDELVVLRCAKLRCGRCPLLFRLLELSDARCARTGPVDLVL